MRQNPRHERFRHRLTLTFGAEITGVDLTRPSDAGIVDLIVDAMDRFAVTVIWGVTVSQDDQIAFAKNFGPLDAINGVLQTDIKRRVSTELVDISNMDEDSNIS